MKTTNKNQNFTPGSHWKDGKLYRFTKTSITVTRPWGKNAGCWTYRKNNGWKNVFQPTTRNRIGSISDFNDILNIEDPRIIYSEPECNFSRSITSLPDFFRKCQDIDNFKRVYNSYDFSEILKNFDRKYFFWALCSIKDYLTVKKFLDAIPQSVLETVALFYHEYHFPLIQFANRTQKAKGLRFMQENPQLAFMLTFNYKRLGYSKNNRYRNIQNLINKKPLDILHKFGLPKEKWVLRFLRKIPLKSLNPRFIPRLICDLNNEDNKKLFTHWTITESSLDEEATFWFWRFYVYQYPLEFMLSIIKKYQKTTNTHFFEHTRQLIFDCFDMARRQGERIKVENLTTLRELEREHDHYVRTIHPQQVSWKHLPAFDFPPPPVPETSRIRYIKDSVSLYNEAVTMQHCVDSYASRIHSGNYAVYHLLESDFKRGFTVGLYKDMEIWTIDTVLGFQNHPAPEEMEQAVKDWLLEENEKRFHYPLLSWRT